MNNTWQLGMSLIRTHRDESRLQATVLLTPAVCWSSNLSLNLSLASKPISESKNEWSLLESFAIQKRIHSHSKYFNSWSKIGHWCYIGDFYSFRCLLCGGNSQCGRLGECDSRFGGYSVVGSLCQYLGASALDRDSELLICGPETAKGGRKGGEAKEVLKE